MMGIEWLKPEVFLARCCSPFWAWRSSGSGFVIVDKITPYDLWAEICEKKNVALAIVVGSTAIAIGLIVSAAIHG